MRKHIKDPIKQIEIVATRVDQPVEVVAAVRKLMIGYMYDQLFNLGYFDLPRNIGVLNMVRIIRNERNKHLFRSKRMFKSYKISVENLNAHTDGDVITMKFYHARKKDRYWYRNFAWKAKMCSEIKRKLQDFLFSHPNPQTLPYKGDALLYKTHYNATAPQQNTV